MVNLSRHAIAEYLLEIKGICAAIEVEMTKHSLDDLLSLEPLPAIEQYGRSKVVYAMMLINDWLKDTPFKTRAMFLQKEGTTDKWADMIAILNARILEYQNDVPMIVLHLTRSGRITRTVDDVTLEHDFSSEGLKKDFLSTLVSHEGYIKTSELQRRIGSKSTESVQKTVASINSVLRAKLQLPPKHKVIEGKRNSGYRLNPLYNIVITS